MCILYYEKNIIEIYEFWQSPGAKIPVQILYRIFFGKSKFKISTVFAIRHFPPLLIFPALAKALLDGSIKLLNYFPNPNGNLG